MAPRPNRRRFDIATPLLVGLASAVACLWVYHELAEDLALSPKIAAFDAQLSSIITSWRTPGLTLLFSAATRSASTLAVAVLVLAIVAVLVWRCDHREALLVALVVATGTSIGGIAKRVTGRPRPPATAALVELPTSYAFPSGHTLAAVLLWTLVAFVVFRVSPSRSVRAGVIGGGFLLAVLVGTSRVYLGVHWPSDVLASWVLGIAWLSVCLGAFLTWERLSGPAPR